MTHLSSLELAHFCAIIGFIIILSKIMGKVFQSIKCSIVVAELLSGIILGPTILGSYYPHASQFLSPNSGNITYALDSCFNISVVILLFTAGLEIDVTHIVKNKKATFLTCIMGILIPFIMGFIVVCYFPHVFNNNALNGTDTIMTASFISIALAISALPVLARILSEINLLHTYIGIITMSAIFITDVIAWVLFSILLGIHEHGKINIEIIIGFNVLLLFILFMLTIGRHLANKYMTKYVKKVEDNLAFILGICLIATAFIEFVGFPGSFGAFIIGIVFNHIVTINQEIKKIIQNFVNSFFAPIFFVSIGLKLNFIKNFDFVIISTILFLAFVSKTAGASLGAYFAGIKPRVALAIGCGMNARGAMEIIFCTIALSAGLITENIFVAFVIMAVITSLASGPLMLWMLRESKTN